MNSLCFSCKKFAILFFVWVGFSGVTTGQVTGVKFLMKYDHDRQEFDVFIYIVSGSATTFARRTQANAQISLVVPTGTPVSITRRYFPLQNNQTYQGTIPNQWELQQHHVLHPAAAPNVDFYAVIPNLSVSSQYNNLFVGDTVKIFSFTAPIPSGCFEDVRFFINGVDPDSSAPGMLNGDYSNGFVIGSITQLYMGNLYYVHPPIAGPDFVIAQGQSRLLTPSPPGTGSWSVWSNNPGLMIDSISPGLAQVTALNTATGRYTIRYRDSFQTDFVCVNISNFRLFITGQNTICNGNPQIITATTNESASYLWNTGETTPSITVIQSGTYKVTATNSSGFSLSDSINVMSLHDLEFLTADTFCIQDTFILPQPGIGFWTSLDENIISIENSQRGICLAEGAVQLQFHDTQHQCSTTSDWLMVRSKPIVQSAFKDTICINESIRVLPSEGGFWTSYQPFVANVSPNGEVRGAGQGTAYLTFQDNMFGCTSDTISITVLPQPYVKNQGNDTLCLLSTTELYPHEGGVWTSLFPDIAEISPWGIVQSHRAGIAVFEFYSDTMVCPNQVRLTVDKPMPRISQNFLPVGSTIQLFPSDLGLWKSDSSLMLNVINNEFAHANLVGRTNLRFQSFTGCRDVFPIEIVSGRHQLYPDFSIPDYNFEGYAQDDSHRLSTRNKSGDLYLVISPNPVTDKLIFTTSKPGQRIIITDNAGSLIYESTNWKNSVEVGHWPKGAYQLNVFIENEWIGASFILP